MGVTRGTPVDHLSEEDTHKSLFHVLQADPGFQSDGVLTASLVLPTPKYQPGTQTHALVGQLTAKLAALPGGKFARLSQVGHLVERLLSNAKRIEQRAGWTYCLRL
jgi:hypothetical protein